MTAVTPAAATSPHVMNTYGRVPIAMSHGQGAWLWDVNGKKYLDGLGGIAVNTLGHNHPQLVAALQDQVAKLIHCSNYYHVPGQEALATELVALSGLTNAFFCSTGLEANEAAIKLARKFGHDKGIEMPTIVVLEKSFHGRSIATLSATGNEKLKVGFGPMVDGFLRVPRNDIEALKQATAHNPNVVAVFVETIQGEGGVNPMHLDYLKDLRTLCDERDWLLMLDEVQSGMGRTGKFLAIEHEGAVDPDIVILAKTLSGGFVPVGAVLCKKWIHEKVFSSMSRSVVHSSTFSQGSFAMAAGLAALDVLDRENLIANAAKMGDLIGQGVQAMISRFEFMKEVRWRGLMVGIEFGSPKSLSLKIAWTTCHTLDKSLFPQAAVIPLLDKHHIITQVAGHGVDVVKLLPPLVINEADVKYFLTAFEDVVVQMHKFPGPAWDVLMGIGKMALTQRAR